MNRICVDSISNENYKRFEGDVSKRKDNHLIKIYHWNLTNKEEFLYNGARPVFQEMGPYVYMFARQKLNVRFLTETIRYQSAMQIEFHQEMSCPNCKLDDKFSTINFGYVGLVKKTGSDTNLAYVLIPSVVGKLLNVAHLVNGNITNTMKRIGKYKQYVLLPDTLTNDFKIDFSAFLADIVQYNTSLIDFTEEEMLALYNIITNSTLLGVSNPVPANCPSDPTTTDCLAMGFLNLVQWLNERQTKVLADGKDPTSDVTFQKLYGTISALFCPHPSTECLDMTRYPSMIGWVATYITAYLTKVTMHLAIDSLDYSIITTRTHKDIMSGYHLSELKLPGLENGLFVNGLMTNDSDLQEAKQKKLYQEIFKCDVPSKNEFAWAKYDGKEYTPKEYFKNASEDFLKITGRHTNTYFGAKKNIAVCLFKQAPNYDSYQVYDTMLQTSFTLRQNNQIEYLDIPVSVYDVDMKAMYGVNNVSVYTQGLLDLSATKNGLPFFISAPHFYNGEKTIVDSLGMEPNEDLHKSYYYIEPFTGSTLGIKNRIQINSMITEVDVASPRLVPYSISYKEKAGNRVTKPFPIIWMEYSAFATKDDVKVFDSLIKALKGSCTALVVGPVIGIIFILAAAYCYWSRVKNASHVNDSETVRKSSTSM